MRPKMKSKMTMRPGPNVGGATAFDDSVPVLKHLRNETIRSAPRGRTEPRRAATPPK